MRAFVKSGFFFIILFAVAPVSFFVARNYTQQGPLGNLLTLGFALALGLVAAALGWICTKAVKKNRIFHNLKCAVSRVIIAGCALLAFPAFSYLIWPEQGPFLVTLIIVLSVSVLVVLFRIIPFYPLNIFLIIFTAISLFTLGRAELKTLTELPAPPLSLPLTTTLQHSPNIYFFFLESFHDRRTLRSEYNFDVPVFFDGLKDRGFTSYDNFISNYVSTIHSATAVLSMRHHYYKYDVNFADANRNGFNVIANNNVFKILKNNGYKINLFSQNANYVFRVQSSLIDYSHFQLDRGIGDGVLSTIDYFNPGAVRIVRHFYPPDERDHNFLATMMESFEDDYPSKFDLTKPSFFYIYTGAAHIGDFEGYYPDGWEEKKWLDTYREKYIQASELLFQILDTILANDPDAMVILVGDHGAFKYGQALSLQEHPELFREPGAINDFFRASHLEPKEVGASQGAVVAAIRWPAGMEAPPVPAKGLSHVTLFPFVLARLAGIPYNEEDYEPNVSLNIISFDNRFQVFAQDGKLLEEWKTMVHTDGKLADVVGSAAIGD